MPKPLPSDSEDEDAKVSDDSSLVATNQGVPDYERQRLSRIAENMKRMEALGLHKMAKSLMKGSTWRSTVNGKKDKVKSKINEDEDYNPYSRKGVKFIFPTKRTREPREHAKVTDDSSLVAANQGVPEDEDPPNSEKGKYTSKSKKTAGKKHQVDPDFVCDDELIQIQVKRAHLSQIRSLRQRKM